MNTQQPETNAIRMQIDACRDGTDDLAHQECAEAARAVQADPFWKGELEKTARTDAALREACEDVALPRGLKERIIEGLQAAANSALEPDSGSVSPAAKKSRRKILALGILATTAAAMIGVAAFLQPGENGFTQQQLLQHSGSWLEAAALRDDWSSDISAVPHGFVFPETILAPPRYFQILPVEGAEAAVAFDLSPPGRVGDAVLLAVKGLDIADDAVPNAPPRRPQSTTGGRSIGLWTTGDTTYILCVSGPGHSRTYENLVRRPGPIA